MINQRFPVNIEQCSPDAATAESGMCQSSEFWITLIPDFAVAASGLQFLSNSRLCQEKWMCRPRGGGDPSNKWHEVPSQGWIPASAGTTNPLFLAQPGIVANA